MADSSGPPLSSDVLEEIAECKGEIHGEYYARLSAMRARWPVRDLMAMLSGVRPDPLEPRQPVKLKRLLASYAQALFDCEVARYPQPLQQHWLTNLAVRVESDVMRAVHDINEHGGFWTLSHHASPDDMRQAVQSGLVLRLVVADNDTPELKPTAAPTNVANSEVIGSSGSESPSVKEARARTVAKIIKELNVLKPQMFDDESEYAKLRTQYHQFLTFKLTDSRPDLKRKVLAIQGSARHYRLAQELAAAHHDRTLATIQDDWKRHKPKEFRR